MSGALYKNTPFGGLTVTKRPVHLRMIDEYGEDGCKAIRYDIKLDDGKVVLHKFMHTNEWFPNGLNGHYPTETLEGLKKFLTENGY